MSSRKLSRIKELDEALVLRCAARSLNTVRELLDLTVLDLSELLDLSMKEAAQLVSTVAAAVCPAGQPVSALLARKRTEASHLPFNLPALDLALRGGAPVGAVTELVGAAGAGKTQACLQLAAAATLPLSAGGLGGSAVYIDTESRFSGERLVEIARGRWPDSFREPASVEALLKGVVVIAPGSGVELLQRLEGLEAVIIEHSVRLVLVDSIAFLVRSGQGTLHERHELLGEQASRLKTLAEAFRIPVIVTNQVTTRVEPGGRAFAEAAADGGEAPGAHVEAQLAASLGTKWAHDVNLRLSLETAETGQRLLSITKSSAAPALSFPFDIGAGGLYITGPAVDVADLNAVGSIRGGAAGVGRLLPDAFNL